MMMRCARTAPFGGASRQHKHASYVIKGRQTSVLVRAETITAAPSKRKPAFPFSKLAGQDEMKLALMLTVVDPNIGGVLIMGDRGTGKSVAVSVQHGAMTPCSLCAAELWLTPRIAHPPWHARSTLLNWLHTSVHAAPHTHRLCPPPPMHCAFMSCAAAFVTCRCVRW